jgi:hypothetical protein
MRAKTRARCNAIIVDDAQIAPAHVFRIVIFGKGEAVARLEPTVIGVAAVQGFSNGQHVASLQEEEFELYAECARIPSTGFDGIIQSN